MIFISAGLNSISILIFFTVNKFKINQSEMSFTSHGFFNNFDIKQSSIPSQVIFVVITNQNEVFTDFEVFCRSEPKYVNETSV